MTTHFPDVETMRAVLSLATMAPSVENSQPWHWDVGSGDLRLYADPSRRPIVTDADRRDVLLSCGAVLHHCTVALAAMGWQAKVHRFPEVDAPDYLARIEVYPQQPVEHDLALNAAISRRRTDRRDYSSRPVTIRDIALMGARAARAGVMLRQIELLPMLTAVVAASVGNYGADVAGYTAERNVGSGRPDGSVILALGTEGDDDLARLRAGEATSLVLLSATVMGLATCPVTEPLQIGETRDAVRADVFGTSGYPQMMLRIGWAVADAEPLPATPRRILADAVSGLGGVAVLAGQIR